jgi:hypothetical protein
MFPSHVLGAYAVTDSQGPQLSTVLLHAGTGKSWSTLSRSQHFPGGQPEWLNPDVPVPWAVIPAGCVDAILQPGADCTTTVTFLHHSPRISCATISTSPLSIVLGTHAYRVTAVALSMRRVRSFCTAWPPDTGCLYDCVVLHFCLQWLLTASPGALQVGGRTSATCPGRAYSSVPAHHIPAALVLGCNLTGKFCQPVLVLACKPWQQTTSQCAQLVRSSCCLPVAEQCLCHCRTQLLWQGFFVDKIFHACSLTCCILHRAGPSPGHICRHS